MHINRISLLLIIFWMSNGSDNNNTVPLFTSDVFKISQQNLQIVKLFEKPDTYFAILEDNNGRKFLVKQLIENRNITNCASEKLAACIAESVGILANRVDIIPAYYSFPGKRYNHLSASLHEFVPGIKISCLPERLQQFNVIIKQAVKPHIPEEERGLTRHIIHNMSLHPDLPRIVALDTFISNQDRHRANILYDEKTNHFYGIDMANSFHYGVAEYACNCINLLIQNENDIISRNELDALCLYQTTLKQLINKYSPSHLCELFVQFTEDQNIINDLNDASRISILKIIKQRKKCIHDNYRSCETLVILLDQLILKYKQHSY